MMLRKFLVMAIVGCCAAVPALAQTVLDAKDPSITKKVALSPTITSYPEYPAAARRAKETGETRVRMCVDERGRPNSVALAVSSGSDKLDSATLKWMSETALFLPAEMGGKPVPVCNYEFTYVWTLNRSPSPKDAWLDYYEIKKLLPSDWPTATLPATPPPYPDVGLATKAKGVVSMAFCISPEGRVVNFEVRKLEPGPDFIEPTLRYFLGSKFTPGTPNNRPVDVCGLELSYEWKAPT